jgi:hypothetical protein
MTHAGMYFLFLTSLFACLFINLSLTNIIFQASTVLGYVATSLVIGAKHFDVRQMDTSLLSLHTTAFKSPLVLTRMSHRFSLCIMVFRSLGMPFLCGLTVPQQQIVFRAKTSNRSGGEKKLFIQFVTNSLYSPRHNCHCAMGCCQVLCHPPSELTQAHIHVIRITS